MTDINYGASRVYNETRIQILGQSWTKAAQLRLPKHNDPDRCIDDPIPHHRKRVGLFIDETNVLP